MPMPTATKTFLLRAIASFAAVLIVNVLSANFLPGGLAVFVFDALRYGLVGAGAFFLVVAACTWGVVLGNSETAPDALHHR